MKRTRIMQMGLVALAALVLACGARADSVDVSLTQTSQTATPGSTITFDATITNLSSTDTVYLNGDSSVTSSTLLTIDDTPFLFNFPLSLDPSEASGPFALFNLFIDPSTPDGTYDFNSFSILGGLDSSSFDTLGAAEFSVTVANPTVTPEPEPLCLLLLGFLAIGALVWRKREWPNRPEILVGSTHDGD